MGLTTLNTIPTNNNQPVVYIIHELPGTKIGTPQFNLTRAQNFGTLKTLLPEHSQIILSPAPFIFQLR